MRDRDWLNNQPHNKPDLANLFQESECTLQNYSLTGFLSQCTETFAFCNAITKENIIFLWDMQLEMHVSLIKTWQTSIWNWFGEFIGQWVQERVTVIEKKK